MPETPFHTLSIDEVLEELDTSGEGISEAEAERRLEEYGPNEIESKEETTPLEILWNQVKDPLVAVLVFAGVISLIAGEELDALIILAVIIINTAIGFFQEYKAETAIEALRSQAAPEAEVLRCTEEDECVERRIKATKVVPGDVILLDTGDRVPADARLLTATNLQVDESMLTGESTGVTKDTEPMEDEEAPTAERTNLVYGGTSVTDGRGKAVVFATGESTEMGEIATLIQETEKVESPLQRQTRNLTKKLGILALSAAVLIFGLGLLQGLVLEEVFLFALAAAVSSIPAGLPAVMSITLAVGVTRMARRNAIIRRLQAVDTLGAATVICTDKTGTLTTNEMTVQQILVDDRVVTVTGTGFTPEGDFELNGDQIDPQEENSVRLALEIGALCNDAHLTQHELDGDEDEPESRWEIRGDPTEGALVVAAAKAHLQKGHLENVYPRIDEIPFSSDRRFMATFHRMSEEEGDEVRVYVKGAFDTILEFCDRKRDGDDIQAIEDADREEIQEENTRMASEALRVLALAYETIDPDDVETFKEELEYGRASLILVGLAGMIDPPRPEVPEAVESCKRAGIRVIMATGDHKLTGEAIARQVGIFEEGDRVLTGTDVEPMSDEELDDAIGETSVFARVSPEHKHRLVQSLQRQGEVVAMTGDGVNDAPALQAAEIGVAMGITGTDVTKETAEMVLTDDNFASIVSAVEEGRVVFENVRKVTKFLLVTNIGEVLTLFTALLFFPDLGLILAPVQILWINLVTDGLLDVTLAMEPKERPVMDDPPREREAAIINKEIFLNTTWVALFMAGGTLWMFIRTMNPDDLARAQTMAFSTLAMFQVFYSLSCRSRIRSFFSLDPLANKYLAGGIVVSVILLILATNVNFLQSALGTRSPTLEEWGLIALVSSSAFVADELRKLVQRRIRSND